MSSVFDQSQFRLIRLESPRPANQATTVGPSPLSLTSLGGASQWTVTYCSSQRGSAVFSDKGSEAGLLNRPFLRQRRPLLSAPLTKTSHLNTY